MTFGRFELRPRSRQLLVEGQPAALGARAFDVLRVLVERRERLVTKDELLDLVWPGVVVEENNVEVQISMLRKILGPDAIATVPGRGYRFSMQVEGSGQQVVLRDAVAARRERETLLERDTFLAALALELEAAASGMGGTVVVSGEAGIGKTTLVEHFVHGSGTQHVLWGACEALFTPHPLGPLHDLVRTSGDRLRNLLRQGSDRGALFSAVLDELASAPTPVIVVLEDVHWADAATLDLVRFLGRRIHRIPALMILTCRDDEASFAQLRTVFGELPSRHVRRMVLPPLSIAAVEALAQKAARSIAGLHGMTGGNPFFVSEVLAHPGTRVPSTIRDAVLARTANLSAAASNVIEHAAIVPRAIEVHLIETILGPALAAIEECVRSGLLIAEGATLRFRHELARAAVEESILAPRAKRLHASVLAALCGEPATSVALARLVHHAHLAGDADAVLRLAPQAAREAASRGARREAAAHCKVALAYAERLDDNQQGVLLDAYAAHCFEINDLATAIPARERAIELFEKTRDVARQSEALAAHAMPLVRALRNQEAEQASRHALTLAQQLPPGAHLAKAHATESYVRMLNRDYREAIEQGEKAIALAEQFDDTATLAAAHKTMGAALLFVDYPRGCDHLRTSLEIAAGLDDGGVAMADAYVMLGSGSGELYEFDNANRYLNEGITFASARDLDRINGYMEAWLALCDVYQGRWDAAGERANAVLARDVAGSTNRVMALVALGRLRTRRGDPRRQEVLDESLALAALSGTVQRLAPVACIRAEAAWLEGDEQRARDEAAALFDLAARKGHPWFLGELAFWLWKTGALARAPRGCAEPYALQIGGQWQKAAAAWERIGCPYEQARALADGDEAAQRRALEMLDALGGRPLVERLRRQMRAAGVRAIARGPRSSTLTNPARLTTREIQVLELVAEGRQNAQIGARLFRSARTVDHHIASILAKLEVGSRSEAVAAARRLGILAQDR
ncbi:MAG TPA: AAA family ATPase [Casimicrobiaceae bacterium]|nr:AAA family ATPase [Casimicrobiaceae bacterium]